MALDALLDERAEAEELKPLIPLNNEHHGLAKVRTV
jgi:hypothetical protein